MHRSIWSFFLTVILMVCMAVLPTGATVTLTDGDSKFLADVTNEGIPLLFEIPGTMKAGIFHGEDGAISSIGQEQTAALDAFLTKINGYTLSDEIKKIRDQYLSSADVYKTNLAAYSTLNSSCGSCITKMNEMYPQLTNEAKKTNTQVIQFYQTSLAPVS